LARSPPFPVFNCARRDALMARLGNLDPDTRRLIAAALPTDLPAMACKLERDRRIRALAARLLDAMPGITDHRLATLIAAAGRRFADPRGGHLSGELFAQLSTIELAQLESEVSSALLWGEMPRWRQILTIIGR
jgi:hypothetical protein